MLLIKPRMLPSFCFLPIWSINRRIVKYLALGNVPLTCGCFCERGLIHYKPFWKHHAMPATFFARERHNKVRPQHRELRALRLLALPFQIVARACEPRAHSASRLEQGEKHASLHAPFAPVFGYFALSRLSRKGLLAVYRALLFSKSTWVLLRPAEL